MDQLSGLFTDEPDEPDVPGTPETDSFNLYKGTVRVFRFVFNAWLKHKSELEDVTKSCEIPDDIVQAVNGSMAQLFVMERNDALIKLKKLAKTFYYMFD